MACDGVVDFRPQHLKMFLSQQICDVFFVAPSNERIGAHRVILASASPVFFNMFAGPMQETNNTELQIDCSLETFTPLLKFAYTGTYSLKSFTTNVDHLLELVRVCDLWGLLVMRDAACQELCNLVDSTTCANILSHLCMMEGFVGLGELRADCRRLCARNFASIFILSESQKLRACGGVGGDVVMLMLGVEEEDWQAIVSRDDLVIPAESDLLAATLEYIGTRVSCSNASTSSRYEKFLRQCVVSAIRLPDIDEFVLESVLYTAREKFPVLERLCDTVTQMHTMATMESGISRMRQSPDVCCGDIVSHTFTQNQLSSPLLCAVPLSNDSLLLVTQLREILICSRVGSRIQACVTDAPNVTHLTLTQNDSQTTAAATATNRAMQCIHIVRTVHHRF
eukprot:c9671_g1_i2.p1 GENE.c9671_g1_i2~~c9671_g1_i2.p1  ORF type:complete len:396 (+),score=116.23 c9671_g1_i2:28-1215(+)